MLLRFASKIDSVYSVIMLFFFFSIGVINILSPIRRNNDLGHPFCDNLRKGDWLMDYTVSRLTRYNGTRPVYAIRIYCTQYSTVRVNVNVSNKCLLHMIKVGEWLKKLFDQLKLLPRYLIPCYFDIIVSVTYRVITLHLGQRLGR